ncbi:hypothetical protein EH31_11550 [Erythrobacter longus]|uniref:GGDEF domain-containing protein n=2 Tax=Erythrobacter longus TaxID=1044 RepID=A0A074M514_ERYLO|nr:hypothetical protein EH31_11550 [Erythrobacter longus]
MHSHNAGACAPQIQECDPADDILIRLDRAGFIVNASQNARQLGIDFEALLLMPHIADFAVADFQHKVTQYFEHVIAGECEEEAIEFPIVTPHSTDEFGSVASQQGMQCSEHDQQWCLLKLSCIGNDGQSGRGALGTLQLVERKCETTCHLETPRISDRLTGLADRRAFVRCLDGSLALNETASVAIFAIDGMRAIYMQYGQTTADEVRWGFARFLETIADQDHILAQVDDERFGVILPGMAPRAAREWAADVLQVFAGLAMPESGCKPEFGASAGIAKAAMSPEWTIRQAELGLVMARAAGGMQTAICRPHSNLLSGHLIERAMENVVVRASRRAG